MKKNNNISLLFILGMVSVCLSFVVFIPFGKNLSSAENTVKLIVFPIIIAVINAVITAHKFKEYRPTNRFQSYVSYLPMFSYVVALAIYAVLVMNRANPTLVMSFNSYIYTVIILAVVAVALSLLLVAALDKINLALSKNEVNVLDVACYALFIVEVLLLRSAVFKPYEEEILAYSSSMGSFLSIVLGLVVVGVFAVRAYFLNKSQEEFIGRNKAELLNLWQMERDQTYYNAELEILFSLNDYSNERIAPYLGDAAKDEAGQVKVQSGELDALKAQVKSLKASQKESSAKHEQMVKAYTELQNKVKVEVATAELDALKKELEVLKDSVAKHEEGYKLDLAQYETAKAELDAKVAALAIEKAPKEEEPKEEPKPKVEAPKKQKEFKPSYEEIVEYAKSLDHSELSVSANPAGNQHKFMVAGKPYLITQKTNNDYRVTFFADESKLAEYLQGYTGLIEVAKSPKVGNWLKIVNSGELDEAFLKQLVKESLDAELAFEAAEAARKEAERLAKEEAKKQEKEAKEKLKEAEKIIAKAAKDAEKAEKEAEKRAKQEAAAQAKAQKELEKAVKAAEKKAQKELEAEKAARLEAEKALEEAEKALEEAEKAA